MPHGKPFKLTDTALIHSFNGYKIPFCVDIHNLLDHSPPDGHYFQVCHYNKPTVNILANMSFLLVILCFWDRFPGVESKDR